MKYIGVHLNSVEAEMLKEIQKKKKEYRNLEDLIKRMIAVEYKALGVR